MRHLNPASESRHVSGILARQSEIEVRVRIRVRARVRIKVKRIS